MAVRRLLLPAVRSVLVLLVSALAAAGLVAVAAEPPPPAPPPAPARPPVGAAKAEEQYKNIQVLKGSPAEQLVPAMQFMAASLGVECEFCHVDRAPEKDDKKEKQAARQMITMTQGINRDAFEGKREVTCYSCHRGASHPLATPEITEGEKATEEAAAKPGEPPPADPILDQYLQAVGGAEALAGVTSRVQKGTLTGLGPQPLPIEVFAKAPDRRASIVHTPRGQNVTAFDGTNGWLGNPGRPPREMSPTETDAVRLDADLRFPARVKELFKSFRVRPSEKIDGREVARVIARNDGQPPVELYFDSQSGLLVRLVRYAETPLGRNPTRIDYADYRDAGGVKIPFRWTVARPGGRFTVQIDEVQANVPVDDGKFVKPTGS